MRYSLVTKIKFKIHSHYYDRALRYDHIKHSQKAVQWNEKLQQKLPATIMKVIVFGCFCHFQCINLKKGQKRQIEKQDPSFSQTKFWPSVIFDWQKLLN